MLKVAEARRRLGPAVEANDGRIQANGIFEEGFV
jgi:hypothetical protein